MLKFQGKEVYLACGHTDMRKSINGLSLIVQGSLELDPFSEAIFVFCNRNRNRLKILEWDGDGFWLYLKRLERGCFKWPSDRNDSKTMTLTNEELTYLLGGPGLIQKLKRQETTEKTIYWKCWFYCTSKRFYAIIRLWIMIRKPPNLRMKFHN